MNIYNVYIYVTLYSKMGSINKHIWSQISRKNENNKKQKHFHDASSTNGCCTYFWPWTLAPSPWVLWMRWTRSEWFWMYCHPGSLNQSSPAPSPGSHQRICWSKVFSWPFTKVKNESWSSKTFKYRTQSATWRRFMNTYISILKDMIFSKSLSRLFLINFLFGGYYCSALSTGIFLGEKCILFKLMGNISYP